MKPKAKTPALLLIALAGWLAGAGCLADPLHKLGDQGAWRHEHSGWVFPKQIGAFSRVGSPYSIDGNSDVGSRYEQAGSEPHVAAIVEVYAADSAAVDAKFQNAKASTTRTAGAAARIKSEEPFRLGAPGDFRATKVTYVSEGETKSESSLYFIEADQWIVKVFASTQATGPDAGARLDAFVNALPWDTLGSPGLLH